MTNQLKSLLGFKNTHISLKRSIGSYSKVQFLWRSIIRNRKFQLKNTQIYEKTYCNIGCGVNLFPDFVNIDIIWRPGVDLCWDIRKGLPFRNESMLGIFTEHCLEHISLEECRKVLCEFYRILKNGGIARIVVPDGGLYLNLYVKSRRGKDVRFPFSEKGEDYKTPMMYVNDVFREYEHKFTYDAETLSLFLKKAGFKDIREESFMCGENKRLFLEHEARRCESLYIEAKK